jgi:hypothetical protein
VQQPKYLPLVEEYAKNLLQGDQMVDTKQERSLYASLYCEEGINFVFVSL